MRIGPLLAAFACCTAVLALGGSAARAQSATVRPTEPVISERTVLPNPALLGTGVGTFLVGYAPAAVVGLASNHKGDDNLIIPVAGPWINLGNRNCTGLTGIGTSGPFEVSTGENCGTSDIERVALIGDGVIQGIGAIQVLASFFVPQRRVTVVGPFGSSKFSVMPSSLSGLGVGAVAKGEF